MQKLIMNRDELRDKIYGCWMGKNIGVLLSTDFVPVNCPANMSYITAQGLCPPDTLLAMFFLGMANSRIIMGIAHGVTESDLIIWTQEKTNVTFCKSDNFSTSFNFALDARLFTPSTTPTPL